MVKFDLSATASLTLYALLCGFSYLAGFWSNFPIGIAEVIYFTSTTDILKSSTMPVLIVALITLFLFNFINLNWHNKLTFKTLSIDWKYRSQMLLIVLYLVFTACFFVYYSMILKNIDQTASAFIAYAFAGSLAIALWLSVFTTFLPNLNYFIRAAAISTICFLPTFIACWGMETGDRLTRGIGSFIVQDSGDCATHIKERFRYIATYGDNTFSYSLKTHSICIQKSNTLILIPENPKTPK